MKIAKALAGVFLPSGTSPEPPGPDKPSCHARARERDFCERPTQSRITGQGFLGEAGDQAWGAGRSWAIQGDPAPAPVPGVSFTHHRRLHLGSTCRRDDVSGSGASLGTDCNSTKGRLASVAFVIAVVKR